jgi:hypothetical protein
MSARQGTELAPALPPGLRGETLGDYATGERQLLDAARRATTPGWAALTVHFADFPPPGPRAHHGRIARAMLEDAAQRQGGQVFALRNGDLVLLCPAATLLGAPRPGAAAGETLPALLARLLRGNTPEGERPVSVLRLPEGRERLLAYAAERLAEGGLTPLEEAVALAELPVGLTPAVEARLLPDLLLRQTAVRLGGAARLQPIFREITYTSAALQAQAGEEAIEADPFLLRHFALRLEERVLIALPAEAGRRGALDPLNGPKLHLNLAPATVLSPDFAALATVCRRHGVGFGVEIALVDAAADPDGYAAARALLADAGMTCVLDHVSPLALLLSNPAALAPDLVKLDWSPRLATPPPDERAKLAEALAACGSDRVLLAGADDEQAVHWGLAQGVHCFQGHHVDAMLAASRVALCREGAACSLRQCAERAGAVAQAGRAGCRNLALLDAGAAA